MFTFKRLFLVVLISLIPHFCFAESWTIDPVHTAVEFKTRHLM